MTKSLTISNLRKKGFLLAQSLKEWQVAQKQRPNRKARLSSNPLPPARPRLQKGWEWELDPLLKGSSQSNTDKAYSTCCFRPLTSVSPGVCYLGDPSWPNSLHETNLFFFFKIKITFSLKMSTNQNMKSKRNCGLWDFITFSVPGFNLAITHGKTFS